MASLVVALGLPVLAQAQDASQRQPTNITPRVGIDNFTGQQGALPQPELTAEQKRLLLQLRIMQIEGGRAYVRQACADPTWVNDYKAQLEEVEVTKRPEAVEAFKIGWNESKARLGPDIVSCETVLPTEG
ncbi:MAG: hypothetical protein AAF213_07285 [Pseudomonadota bacterium]